MNEPGLDECEAKKLPQAQNLMRYLQWYCSSPMLLFSNNLIHKQKHLDNVVLVWELCIRWWTKLQPFFLHEHELGHLLQKRGMN